LSSHPAQGPVAEARDAAPHQMNVRRESCGVKGVSLVSRVSPIMVDTRKAVGKKKIEKHLVSSVFQGLCLIWGYDRQR